MNILNLEFLIIDYFVLIFTTIIIIISFWKGFINSVLSLLTWVGSIFITIYTYDYLAKFLNDFLLNLDLLSNFQQFTSILSTVIAIPVIFLISLFILKRIRKFLSSDLDKQILGLMFDKFFGAIYGIIFSYVIYSSILYFTYDNAIESLKSLNLILIENSNILNKIAEYNNGMFSIYTNN